MNIKRNHHLTIRVYLHHVNHGQSKMSPTTKLSFWKRLVNIPIHVKSFQVLLCNQQSGHKKQQFIKPQNNAHVGIVTTIKTIIPGFGRSEVVRIDPAKKSLRPRFPGQLVQILLDLLLLVRLTATGQSPPRPPGDWPSNTTGEMMIMMIIDDP